MNAKTSHARKLTAVYESLTATILQFAESHPEVVDTISLPMLDLENVVNEANGHRETPSLIDRRRSKTH
jgi:hypothetical protein